MFIGVQGFTAICLYYDDVALNISNFFIVSSSEKIYIEPRCFNSTFLSIDAGPIPLCAYVYVMKSESELSCVVLYKLVQSLHGFSKLI